MQNIYNTTIIKISEKKKEGKLLRENFSKLR